PCRGSARATSARLFVLDSALALALSQPRGAVGRLREGGVPGGTTQLLSVCARARRGLYGACAARIRARSMVRTSIGNLASRRRDIVQAADRLASWLARVDRQTCLPSRYRQRLESILRAFIACGRQTSSMKRRDSTSGFLKNRTNGRRGAHIVGAACGSAGNGKLVGRWCGAGAGRHGELLEPQRLARRTGDVDR